MPDGAQQHRRWQIEASVRGLWWQCSLPCHGQPHSGRDQGRRQRQQGQSLPAKLSQKSTMAIGTPRAPPGGFSPSLAHCVLPGSLQSAVRLTTISAGSNTAHNSPIPCRSWWGEDQSAARHLWMCCQGWHSTSVHCPGRKVKGPLVPQRPTPWPTQRGSGLYHGSCPRAALVWWDHQMHQTVACSCCMPAAPKP